MSYKSILDDLLTVALGQQASDVHFSVGHPPVLRIGGRLVKLVKKRNLTADDTKALAVELMSDSQQEKFSNDKEIDFSYNFVDKARFRVNIFFQKGNVSCALRYIPTKIPSIEELGLPSIVHEFIRPNQGFFLVTGPSSQGKSTTLASLINEINKLKSVHVVTIEDPIEYIFEADRSIIDQREIGKDTHSFAGALKSTFRQDPDVIMVGEMRDAETIATAITAAETGHLVLATLHTNSAASSIHRMVDSFEGAGQSQIRAQLSGSLLGILSQRLVPRSGGGLIPACEIMLNTPAVSNLIRDNKIHEIPMVIETSSEIGMISLNRYLSNLVREKEISIEAAQNYSLNPAELRSLVNRQ